MHVTFIKRTQLFTYEHTIYIYTCYLRQIYHLHKVDGRHNVILFFQ